MLDQLNIIGGNMYKVKRKIRIDSQPIVEVWKKHLHCDKVFMNKKAGYYYFCESVPDVEFTEEFSA
jgi:hypothetical protein